NPHDHRPDAGVPRAGGIGGAGRSGGGGPGPGKTRWRHDGPVDGRGRRRRRGGNGEGGGGGHRLDGHQGGVRRGGGQLLGAGVGAGGDLARPVEAEGGEELRTQRGGEARYRVPGSAGEQTEDGDEAQRPGPTARTAAPPDGPNPARRSHWGMIRQAG